MVIPDAFPVTGICSSLGRKLEWGWSAEIIIIMVKISNCVLSKGLLIFSQIVVKSIKFSYGSFQYCKQSIIVLFISHTETSILQRPEKHMEWTIMPVFQRRCVPLADLHVGQLQFMKNNWKWGHNSHFQPVSASLRISSYVKNNLIVTTDKSGL